jgi:hypothetical protein
MEAITGIFNIRAYEKKWKTILSKILENRIETVHE